MERCSEKTLYRYFVGVVETYMSLGMKDLEVWKWALLPIG